MAHDGGVQRETTVFPGGSRCFFLGAQVVPVVAQSGDRRALEPWRKAYYGVLLYDQEKCRPTGFEPSGVATIRSAEEQLRKMAGSLASSTEEWTIKTKAGDAARDGCRGAAKAFERSALSILRQSDEFEILKQAAPPPAPAVAAVPAPPPSAPAATMSAPPAAAAPSAAQPRPSVPPVTAPPVSASPPGAPTQARPPAPAPANAPTASAPQRPAAPPQPAATASASAPRENARLRRLTQSGGPEDLVFLVNVSPTAPNAARDLDGNIVFRSSRADACVLSPVAEDVSRVILVERWFTARNVRVGAAAIRSCGDADFSQSDIGIGLRKDIGALQPRAEASLAALADSSNLDVVVVETAADRRVVERARADAREANAQAIEAERAGIGYLVFETQSTASCMLTAEANRLWGQNIEPQLAELQRDLASRAPLRSVVSSPNDAFIAARRGECRLVVGEAADLKRMRAAAQRERMAHRIGAVWLAPAANETPRVAEAPQSQGNSANERLRSLGATGQPDDLLLLVNVAASAPSAARDLDNNIVFRLPRVDICRQVDIANDVAWWVATERWFAAVPRRMTIVPTQFPTCSGADPRQADGLILLRKDLSSLDTGSLGALGALADANQLEPVVLESVSDRAAADRARGVAREANAQAIESGRAGVGYLVIDNRSTIACVLAGEAQRTWSARIAQQTVDLQRDLGSRTALREVSSTPNDAFIAARRGECRIVVGEAADLQRLRGAVQREQLAHQVGAVWLAPAASDTPRVAEAPQAQGSIANERLRAFAAAGQPDDLLLLINVAATAPSAARDLDNNVVFRLPRVEICRQIDIAADVAWWLATERWFASVPRRMSIAPTQVPACSGADPRQADGTLLLRKDLSSLDTRILGGLGALADANQLELIVLESASDRAAADRARSAAREGNGQAIETGLAGIGYLVMDNRTTVACVLAGEAQRSWSARIAQQLSDLQRDLGSRAVLREVPSTPNDAFIAARRGECRIVVGEAGDLKRLRGAVQREQLAHQVGAVWLGAPAAEASKPATATPVQQAATNPQLDSILAEGNPEDLVLVVNVTASAPNAARDLDDNIVFRRGRFELCRHGDITSDVASAIAIERWLADNPRRITTSAAQLPSCAGRDPRQGDGALVKRKDLSAMDPRMLSGITGLAGEKGLAVVVISSAADREEADRARALARDATTSAIESGRAGVGYLVVEKGATAACFTSTTAQTGWQRQIAAQGDALALDLGSRSALRPTFLMANEAFIAAGRGECRIIVGEAADLGRILTAARRTQLAVMPGAIWFDAPAPNAPAPAVSPAAPPPPSPAAAVASPVMAAPAPAASPKLPVFFEELEAGGNRADVVLLINVTSGAPNAVVNLAGRVVFQNARADLCVVGTPSTSLAHELAIERWFAERSVDAANIRRPPCAEQAFSALDGILVRRDEAARMPERLLEAVANQGAARNINAAVIVSLQDLQSQERAREVARAANIQGIETGRAGAGIVTFENSSSTACVAASGDIAMWGRLIVSATQGLIQELGQRIALETSAQDIDSAYLNAKRGTCRMIVGSGQQLGPVRAATARDRVAARVSATWFAAETIRDAEAALTAERDAARRVPAVNPPATSFSPPATAAPQAGLPPTNQVSGTVASGGVQSTGVLPSRQLGNAGPELVQGKVNLVMGRAENRFGSCSIGIRLENLTTMFFQDYAPRVTIVDRDGNKLGDVSFATRGENLRPNAVASSDGITRNITCDIVAQVVVSGWDFCKFQDLRQQSICEGVLNVVPSTGIPMIKR